MYSKKKPIIISLGGSLIVPDEINPKFLRQFSKLVRSLVANGQRFVIITGGGRTARNYQNAAKQVVKITNEDLDWLGIHATRINAHLLRTIFTDLANPRIITHPNEKIKWAEPILLGAGWKPGWSTDYDAVLIAKQVGAETIINLSNISHVYSGDPKKDPAAKPLDRISWADYRRIIPTEWQPGLSSPFDPVASKMAEKLKLKVLITDGENLANLKKALLGLKFRGTTIG
jgi:uridylate kinase